MNETLNENEDVENGSQAKYLLLSENCDPLDYQNCKNVSLCKDEKAKQFPLSSWETNCCDINLGDDIPTGASERVAVDEKVEKYLKSLDPELLSPESKRISNQCEQNCCCAEVDRTQRPEFYLGIDTSPLHRFDVRTTATTPLYSSINRAEKKLKRLSLPNIFSGCVYATGENSVNVKLVHDPPKVFNVPLKTFAKTASTKLLSGGTVIYKELSKYISLPNLYTQAPPIVIKDVQSDSKQVEISPIHSLSGSHNLQKMFHRSLSGGECTEEGVKRKVSLPNLFSEMFPDRQLFRPSVHRSMSGGMLIDRDDEDRV